MVLFTLPYPLVRGMMLVVVVHCKNIRISTDILWRIFQRVMQPTLQRGPRLRYSADLRTQTNAKPIPSKYGKLATKYPWIYGSVFYSVAVVCAADGDSLLRVLENDTILQHDAVWPHGLNFRLSVTSFVELTQLRASCRRHGWPESRNPDLDDADAADPGRSLRRRLQRLAVSK